jgi:MFS family permease
MPTALIALLQFFLALTWIVYVIYLPALAAQAGIDKRYVPMILLMDQVIFIACDWAAGVYADRVARAYGRVGGVMAVATLVSCVAFIALPYVAPGAGPVVFLFLTVLWSATSSALRAPPFVLMSRYSDKSRAPWVVGFYLFGLGVASAIAPFLGVRLKAIDPRIPFLLASTSVALCAYALARAERGFVGGEREAREPQPVSSARLMAFAAAMVLLAVGFQVHFSINSGPSYLKFAPAAALPNLMPVFWIGFNIAAFPATWLVRRFTALRVLATSGFIGAVALVACASATSLDALVAAQLVAGAAWSAALVGAFGLASELSGPGREGTFTGTLFSLLALAAAARIAMVVGGLPAKAGTLFLSLPFLAWAIAAAIVTALAIRPAPSAGPGPPSRTEAR